MPHLRNLRKLYLNRNRISQVWSTYSLTISTTWLLFLNLWNLLRIFIPALPWRLLCLSISWSPSQIVSRWQSSHRRSTRRCHRLPTPSIPSGIRLLGTHSKTRSNLRPLQELSLETNALSAIPSAALVNQRETLTNLNLGLNNINEVFEVLRFQFYSPVLRFRSELLTSLLLLHSRSSSTVSPLSCRRHSRLVILNLLLHLIFLRLFCWICALNEGSNRSIFRACPICSSFTWLATSFPHGSPRCFDSWDKWEHLELERHPSLLFLLMHSRYLRHLAKNTRIIEELGSRWMLYE